MIKTKSLAQIVRVLTVPPVLVCVLFCALWFSGSGVFAGVGELLLSAALLAFMPLLAYPAAALVPSVRGALREGQRKLSFVFSLVGYLASVVVAFAGHLSAGLKLIVSTYLLSAVVLTLFNKALRIRASGHACGVAGPLVLSLWFFGPWGILPCAVVLVLVVWSSLLLGRHSLRELAWGGLTSVVSFCCCALLTLTPLYRL